MRTVLHTEANPILGLNVVIDDERRLGFASFGHIATSHARAVDFIRSYAEVGVAGPRFDTVVTSSAGYPLDKTYYQTVKGMCLALGVLAPGGDLIIASENSEGLVSTHQHSRPLRRLLFAKAWPQITKLLLLDRARMSSAHRRRTWPRSAPRSSWSTCWPSPTRTSTSGRRRCCCGRSAPAPATSTCGAPASAP